MKTDKTIRLAVIGSTSSGKTYLLSDLLESLSRLGYNCRAELGVLYASPFDFRQKLQSEGEVRQTPLVNLRKIKQYRGTFRHKGFNRSFELGFLDIPGELFLPEKMMRFTNLINALSTLGKYFEYDVYTRGNERSKVLRFIGFDGGAEESEGYKAIITAYKETGYKEGDKLFGLRNKLGLDKVSGMDVVKNFFDFDTDSVVEAVAQAIPMIEAKAEIRQSEFFNDDVGSEMVYFFYALYATDVVLCDKLVMPSSAEDSVVTNSPSPVIQLQRLYNIEDFNPGKKRFYMAFRGVDALLNDCLCDLKDYGMNIDHIYALMLYLLEYRLTGTNMHGGDQIRHLGNFIDTYISQRSVASYADKYLNDDYKIQPYYDQGGGDAISFGQDLYKALLQRINMAVEDFMNIRGELQTDDKVFMTSNVFLTSSAVANEGYNYKVEGNDPTNVRRMAGNARNASTRACLGTLQLTMSLLLRNRIRFESCETIDLIEKYIH